MAAATLDDWTRVDAGTFHDFHQGWLSLIKFGLNEGVLPPGFYAHQERKFGAISAGENESDVLALEVPATDGWGEPVPEGGGPVGGRGGAALLEAPPEAALETDLSALPDLAYYAAKQSRLAIKREIDHRVVALIELVSPGNKDRAASVARFVDKAVEALEDGIHLVLIDLLPPGPADPAGMRGAILDRLGFPHEAPAGRPLCVSAFRAGPEARAFARPAAVGESVPEAPLFLTPRHHVPVPLADSYDRARDGIGFFWREVLAGARPAPAGGG